MIVYVAVPRTGGSTEEKMEALGELQALIDAGYSACTVETKYADHGTYRVFGMERVKDRTDLDPTSFLRPTEELPPPAETV